MDYLQTLKSLTTNIGSFVWDGEYILSLHSKQNLEYMIYHTCMECHKIMGSIEGTLGFISRELGIQVDNLDIQETNFSKLGKNILSTEYFQVTLTEYTTVYIKALLKVDGFIDKILQSKHPGELVTTLIDFGFNSNQVISLLNVGVFYKTSVYVVKHKYSFQVYNGVMLYLLLVHSDIFKKVSIINFYNGND